MSQKAALVIDDSKSIRFAMRKLLEAQGYAVTMAETAEQGLEHLASRRPSVIFLDHLLPGISGFEVLRKIKSDARTVTIPVVICSSQEGEAFVTMVRSRGALDVLHKPPSAELIGIVLERLEKVAAALRGEGARPPPAPPEAPAPAADDAAVRKELAVQLEELRAQLAELEAEVAALGNLEPPDPARLRQQIRDELKSVLAGTREELKQEARATAAETAQKLVSAAGTRIVEQVKALVKGKSQ